MKLSGETKLLLIMGGFVLLGGGTLVGLNVAGQSGKLPLVPPPAATPAPVAWTDAKFGDLLKNARHVRGDANAPLTIVEFADFECPSCRRAFNETIIKMEKNKTPVRFVFHHLPLTTIHQRAMPAALAAEAADKQGKFWPMYDALFDGAETELNDQYIMACAKKIGLDTARFEKDWKNAGELMPLVTGDQDLAKSFNIGTTPTFVVRDKTGKFQQMEGSIPIAAFMEGKSAATPPPAPAAP